MLERTHDEQTKTTEHTWRIHLKTRTDKALFLFLVFNTLALAVLGFANVLIWIVLAVLAVIGE